MADKTDVYWNLFEHSGSVDAYLEYSQLKNKNIEKAKRDRSAEPLL